MGRPLCIKMAKEDIKEIQLGLYVCFEYCLFSVFKCTRVLGRECVMCGQTLITRSLVVTLVDGKTISWS